MKLRRVIRLATAVEPSCGRLELSSVEGVPSAFFEGEVSPGFSTHVQISVATMQDPAYVRLQRMDTLLPTLKFGLSLARIGRPEGPDRIGLFSFADGGRWSGRCPSYSRVGDYPAHE